MCSLHSLNLIIVDLILGYGLISIIVACGVWDVRGIFGKIFILFNRDFCLFFKVTFRLRFMSLLGFFQSVVGVSIVVEKIVIDLAVLAGFGSDFVDFATADLFELEEVEQGQKWIECC